MSFFLKILAAVKMSEANNSLRKRKATRKVAFLNYCGGGGIRTPEGFYTLPVFKTGAINRSTTPPKIEIVLSDAGAKISNLRFLNNYANY